MGKITIRCTCGKTLEADDKFAGRRAKCSSCGVSLVIPVLGPPESQGTPSFPGSPQPSIVPSAAADPPFGPALKEELNASDNSFDHEAGGCPIPRDEAKWYYTVEGKRFGPVIATQIQELAHSGRLRGSDLVWTESLDKWTPANMVKGLLLQGETAPPPLPGGMLQTGKRDARSRVRIPAMALLLLGVFDLIVAAVVFITSLMEAAELRARTGFASLFAAEQASRVEAIGITIAMVALAVGIVTIISALKMKKLESFGFAITTSIIAIVTGGLPGIPIGIWCLAVLTKPEVKASFQ